MKKRGSSMEFVNQRRAELVSQFRRLMSQARHINMRELAGRLVEQPASRFWVSEERASVIVLALESGHGVLEGMRPAKRAMFQEIYRRYKAVRPQMPGASVLEVVSAIVYEPAPRHYMEPRAALEEMYRHRRKRKS